MLSEMKSMVPVGSSESVLGELIRSHAGVARAKGDVDPKRDDEIINVKPLSNMLK
jgi:hypothetical protein